MPFRRQGCAFQPGEAIVNRVEIFNPANPKQKSRIQKRNPDYDWLTGNGKRGAGKRKKEKELVSLKYLSDFLLTTRKYETNF
jgi:hypothetical protein